MRFRLVIFFCVLSFSASAQFWNHISFKKKHIILSVLDPARGYTFKNFNTALRLNNVRVDSVAFAPCEYTIEATSVAVMEMAKHNMRFRIYQDASYNFSDLAKLYIQLHRLSEAKWYLLQSNNISRQENDDKHTITNLVILASVKADIGDIPSARADLLEARDLARVRGMQPEVVDIEKKILLLAQGTTTPAKVDVKYAESTGIEKKAL